MEFLWTLLGESLFGKILVTLLISMFPIVELRGAIPVAVLLHDLHPVLAFTVSVIGNLIPVPFIIIFIRKIFHWIRKHIPKLGSLVDRLEEKGKSKKDAVLKLGFWGLFIFVAIPLPMTGAWTGSLIAAFFGFKKHWSILAIFLGVLVAGVIMTLASLGALGIFNVFAPAEGAPETAAALRALLG